MSITKSKVRKAKASVVRLAYELLSNQSYPSSLEPNALQAHSELMSELKRRSGLSGQDRMHRLENSGQLTIDSIS